MIPTSSGIRTINIVAQARCLSGCLVLNSSKAVSLSDQCYRIMNVKSKAVKKKSKKKHIVVKRVSDDIEAVWLENLDSKNIKLFRKTSFGSFRKINLDNLLKKLKEIYPTTFESEHFAAVTSQKENLPPIEPTTGVLSDDLKAPPCLSEYLIKHIMEFPLLKSQNENSFCKYAKMEVEDFGAIDAVMFPSVTGILNETMSKAARQRLKMWKDKMIAQLGVDGFLKYQEDPEANACCCEFPNKSRKRIVVDLLRQGSKFHSTIKTYLEVTDKKLVTIDPEIEGCWKSLEKLLPDISDVQFVEESVHHPVLMYKGIVDCVAAYRGTPCVIEWKKSSKAKRDLSSTFDAPIQLSAYLGALPWHKNVTIKNGLVVVAYTDGTPANVFELSLESCELYWTEWLRRVQSYWLKKSSTLVQDEAEV